MAFLDLTSALAGWLPGLSPFLADALINSAWVDICNRRLWNWLQQDAAVFCPAQITAGTVAITQGQLTVTANAAASAALAVQQATGLPTVTNLQIRFSPTSPAAGQVYNIVAYDAAVPAAVVLTLDRVVVEATAAAAGYQCYRCYIVPPVAAGAFLRWESVVDVANGYRLKKDRTSAAFDASDPQRASQGLATFIGSYEANRVASAVTGATVPNPNQSAGVPNYELWPHPVSGQNFYVRMRVKGQPFVQPTDTPPTNLVDDQLIIQTALYKYAYPWAQANVGHFPTMKGANWSQLIVNARALVTAPDGLLVAAIRMDNEQGLQDVWNRGHGLRDGINSRLRGNHYLVADANWLQSHLVNL